jgi:tetratricopeptide (TPR) repeat protein
MEQARDYEALIHELLAGVAGGWSYGNVIILLMTKGVDEEDLSLWLREFAEGLSLERDGELIEQLKLLGNMTPGRLASEAFTIVARLDSSYGQGSELLNYQAWLDRGNELFGLSRYVEALASFEQAIAINPVNDAAWHMQGIVLCDCLRKYEEALASFEQAIAINPDNYFAINNRAIAILKLGRYEEALASLEQVIAINPDNYLAWTSRGCVLFNLGQYEEAIASCDRVIEIKPDFHQAWYGRGVAILKLERYAEAIASYERVIEIKPDDYLAWDGRGVALGILHGYQAEVRAYQAAFQHIHSDTHPEGYGFLQHRIGRTHYGEGNNQLLSYRRDPHFYYGQALTSYHNALTTLTRAQFPKLRLETLIDTAKACLAQKNPSAARDCQIEANDILGDLLNAEPTFAGKKRLQIEYVSLSQLDVDLFVASGDNINALQAAELDKNNHLTWLLSALAETTISPSYPQMQQLLDRRGLSEVETRLTGIVYWHLSPDNLTTFILNLKSSLVPVYISRTGSKLTIRTTSTQPTGRNSPTFFKLARLNAI